MFASLQEMFPVAVKIVHIASKFLFSNFTEQNFLKVSFITIKSSAVQYVHELSDLLYCDVVTGLSYTKWAWQAY